MCKYCETTSNRPAVESIYYDDLDVYIIGNELNIDLNMNIEDVYIDNEYEIVINYCPMCGRKLKEG